MFQIGEFSIITKLSVKTLRFYHKEGILAPDYIDEDSGYRYYKQASINKAFVISNLRNMDFSINEIKEILAGYSEDSEIVHFLESKFSQIKNKINQYQSIESNLDFLITSIKEDKMDKVKYSSEIIEKNIDDIIYAGCRYTGVYSEIGKAISTVAKKAGRFISGKPISLYYDGEYKEFDADIESGFPVRKTIKHESINCRVLKGGKAVTIQHKGPYEELGKSYEKLLDYINHKKYSIVLPHREIYLKGPGFFFRGNPKKYLTEIQFFIKE